MNAKKELEKVLEHVLEKQNREEGNPPSLLLHSCCAPCSSYVLEYLSDYFEITVFYYNPNISPLEEYLKRGKEQEQLIAKMKTKYPVTFLMGEYENQKFYACSKGLEQEPECGLRCDRCYELRLRKTGELGKELEVDYFTTTLTISPLKKADKLNEIGLKLEAEMGVKYLVSDFKKNNGYKRSTELSKEYELYRQDFCGCIYSSIEAKKKAKEKVR